MNADNPDTAKIINGLLSGLMQQGISASLTNSAQTILQALKMFARESEIVMEADIPEKIVADFIRAQSTPKKAEPAKSLLLPSARCGRNEPGRVNKENRTDAKVN